METAPAEYLWPWGDTFMDVLINTDVRRYKNKKLPTYDEINEGVERLAKQIGPDALLDTARRHFACRDDYCRILPIKAVLAPCGHVYCWYCIREGYFYNKRGSPSDGIFINCDTCNKKRVAPTVPIGQDILRMLIPCIVKTQSKEYKSDRRLTLRLRRTFKMVACGFGAAVIVYVILFISLGIYVFFY